MNLPRLRTLLLAARSETLHAALVLALATLVFLGTPISRYSEVHYSAADLTQDFSLTKLDPRHRSSNKLMSDSVTEMQPWLEFNREELRSGRVPLWNPYNGAGCPHFANYQSAVFSIFSVPFYVLGMRAALIVSAFMKLFALGFFTYLFLKEIGLRQIPAIAGGIAFMFAGHNILLLSFPHVGAIFAMPAGFFFVERAIKKFEAAYAPSNALSSNATHGSSAEFTPIPAHTPVTASSRAHPALWPSLAGLTISLTIGLLAGNPEPFYFALAFLCVYVCARLAWAWAKLGANRASLAKIGALAGKLAFAGLLAAGFSAFQLLPFYEYLKYSRVFEQRSFSQTPLETTFWPLLMFPNILGNPSTAYILSYSIPPPNFEHVNTEYTGGLVCFLALLSLAFARRDRYVAFFGASAVLWAFYAHNLLGASKLFEKIPTLDIVPMNRSQGIWHFALSVCMALGLNHLLVREDRVRAYGPALATLCAGLAFLALFTIGADRVIRDFATFESPHILHFAEHVPPHIRWIGTTYAIGLAAISVAWMARHWIPRGIACSAAVVIVFLQSAYLFKDYNPVTENRFFFPVTRDIAALQSNLGKDQLLILGEDSIPPNSNMVYGLAMLPNYDGMWVKDFDFLYRDSFGDGHNWRPALKATSRALKIFGVRYVLAKWDWIFTDAGLATFPKAAGQRFITHPILPGRDLSQTFLSHHDGLQAVSVYMSTYPNGDPCTVDFKLEEVATGNVVHKKRVSSVDIQADIFKNRHIVFPYEWQVNPQGRMVSFTFGPLPDSREKLYRFTLSSLDSDPESVVIAWSTPLLGYGEGRAHQAGEQLPGEVLFDFYFNWDEFDRVAKIGDYGLFRFKNALEKFHVVGGAVIAESNEEAVGLLRVPTFDPERLVVLSDVPANTGSSLTMGPRDNSKARLVQFPDSVKVYLVNPAEKSLVHIEDEVTFLANKFKWKQIEHAERAGFADYAIIEKDRDAQVRNGLRVVSPQVGGVPPRVVEETPTFAKVELELADPGYLVVAQAYFPGWKAKVNGAEVPVHRANYAFSAIEVARGKSEVEFYYDPDSLRWGVWIGLASLVAAIAPLLWMRYTRGKAPPRRDSRATVAA